MTDLITLEESAGTPVKKGKRWYVTVAKPGQGMNGFYSEDALKNTGHIALPAGTKSYFGHAKTEDRDPRDQVGVFEEGAFWNDEEGELGAFLTPFPRYAQVLEEAGENIEASVHVAARTARGTKNVTELVFRRDNTVDLVAFAGLEGSGLKYQVESLFAAAAADSEDNEGENNVDITKEMWETLTGSLTGLATKFDTFVSESLVERQGVADEAAVDAAVVVKLAEALTSIAEVEKSIDDADIPAVVKESLKAAARIGEDITDSLAGAVSIVAETKKELAPAPRGAKRDNVVVVNESLNSETPNFKIPRWS